MHNINLDDFNYNLPDELIAQRLAVPRDSSRLMILQKNNKEDKILHKRFFDIIDFLKKSDVLVMNNTMVDNAKLIGKKSTGSSAEIVLMKKISDLEYEVRIKTKNPMVGNIIILKSSSCEIIDQKTIDTFIVRLSSSKVLEDAILPTPPYIKRKLSDKEYQTVYSKIKGSLAAPTAGLHFTKELLEKIKRKGVKIVFVTLHVSYGTFKNIDLEIENHVMDPEYFEITKDAADAINNRKGRLIAVGTTTLKTLESSSKNGKILPSKKYSELFIYPGHKFNSGTDVLITNFHLPKSTLMLLVCAYAEQDRIMSAYKEAISKKYRFFSLGDAMWIER